MSFLLLDVDPVGDLKSAGKGRVGKIGRRVVVPFEGLDHRNVYYFGLVGLDGRIPRMDIAERKGG